MSAQPHPNTTSVADAAQPAVRGPSIPRWYFLYFLLAAFDVLTVSASLFLNHRLTELYGTAVEQNQQWARRLADLSELRQAAGAVNAPGNDVFDSMDVDTESDRLRRALADFNARRAHIISSYDGLPGHQRDRIVNDLSQVNDAMTVMVGEADFIFGAFRAGQPDRAGQRMATMDRRYALVGSAFARTEQTLRDLQAAQLGAQASLAQTLRRTEFILGGLVLLMIGGVMIYGHAMSTALRRASEEREGFLAAVQTSEERTRSIVESATEGIFTFDERGHIKSANSALARFAGVPAATLVGRHLSTLVPALGDVEPSRLFDTLASGASGTTPATVWSAVSAGGAHREVELAVSEAAVNSGRLFTVVMHDVTARTQVATALEHARQSAEEASLAKSAFLANMSHELRTPLNAIIGYGEMLHEAAEERGDTESADDLARIHTAGKHLLSLINDILDLSKIEAGKTTLHIEDVKVATLFSDVEMTAEGLAARSGNRLEFQIGPSVGTISVDVVKLRQILLNLIGNACKFTTNGTVTIAAEVFTSNAGPLFRVSVTDSGIGMSAEQLGRLFKPFSQADASTTRKYGGTGLGLVLSQRFAQLLGGTITVSSHVGVGSQFVVTLPLKQASGTIEVADRTAATVQPSAHDSYVLIIDDDPLTQELIGRQLTKMGVTWRSAFSAAEALRMAREQTPRAITLDLLLPDQHGLSVLSTLKADPVLSTVPVVVVSILDDRHSGYALGASEYLVKPIDSAQLAATMSRLLPVSGPRRVLVVDDDDDARSVMARRVTELGAVVSQAANGAEALESVRAQRPDLVLLDLMMPVLDGFGVMDAMRDDPKLRDVPIVIVTARDMAEDDLTRLTGSVTALVQKQQSGTANVIDEIGRLVAGHTRDQLPQPAVAAQLTAASSAAGAAVLSA